jgi:tetraacyldisaccharide 4'-kinase
MLAERLAPAGKTAVLIRGYGEDEWKMLGDKLGVFGAKVFVGRDRVKSVKTVCLGGARSVILDDGFQHRRLERDLDIVLVDSTDPFGNRHIFPRGILREPLIDLKRAGIIVLTKTDRERDTAAIEGEIKKISPGAAIVKAFHRPQGLSGLWGGGREALSSIDKKNVCIFSAICDPAYFRYTVERAGATIGREFIFPDHYVYKRKDLERIFRDCETRGIGVIITTEKDAVKLKKFDFKSAPGIFALSVKFEITEGEEALDAELRRLHMR